MLNVILTFFKGHKTILSILGVVATLLTIYLSWNSIKDNLYQEGYQAAVQEYQVKFIEQQRLYTEDTERRIRELRDTLQRQYEIDLQRVKSEEEIDTRVETVTEYIEKEIYVKEECNTVPVDLNRMFNQSINSINGSSTSR